MRRVDPGGPREARRQTWHVAVEWIERLKEQAEAEGVSQAAIVDRAFRHFFSDREGLGSLGRGRRRSCSTEAARAIAGDDGATPRALQG
jgi:hypothetical protein